jgi:hypothetical protein
VLMVGAMFQAPLALQFLGLLKQPVNKALLSLKPYSQEKSGPHGPLFSVHVLCFSHIYNLTTSVFLGDARPECDL